MKEVGERRRQEAGDMSIRDHDHDTKRETTEGRILFCVVASLVFVLGERGCGTGNQVSCFTIHAISFT